MFLAETLAKNKIITKKQVLFIADTIKKITIRKLIACLLYIVSIYSKYNKHLITIKSFLIDF